MQLEKNVGAEIQIICKVILKQEIHPSAVGDTRVHVGEAIVVGSIPRPYSPVSASLNTVQISDTVTGACINTRGMHTPVHPHRKCPARH